MELQIIQSKIYEIRGKKVMLDFDLAALYEVETRVLKQAVRRNINRFPADFMFELSDIEAKGLITIGTSQNVISPTYNIGVSKMFAFTEQGVAMLSAVLRSSVAVDVSISIMRAFVAIREYLINSTIQSAELNDLKHRIRALESGSEDTLEAVNDLSEDLNKEIENIYLAIAELSVKVPAISKPRNPMGYNIDRDRDSGDKE